MERFITRERYFLPKASAMLKKCLFELIDATTESHNEPSAVTDIRQYIADNYHDTSLDNNTIASHLGYHPYYLGRIFKSSAGVTVHRYLTQYRLSIAKNLLAATDDGVETVSWKCGFSSVSNFIKVFREHTGITPLRYRKSLDYNR